MSEAKLLFWCGRGFVARAIQYFSGGSWTHVALYLDGYTYEFDAHGARRTPGEKSVTAVRVPIRELTEPELAALRRYWAGVIRWHNIYAFATLVALIVILPTRWVWERIGWRPFSAKWWGRVCSSGVAEGFKKAGIDLVPERAEVYETPTEVYESWFLKDPPAT